MKRIFITAAVLSAVFISVAAIFPKKDLLPLTKENITPELLWKRVTAEDDYHKYASWPERKPMQPGASPHGAFDNVFINDIVAGSIPLTNKPLPFGSLIVKEGYNIDKELINILVITKISNFNPENNDWYWARFAPDGKALYSGKVQACINCHLPFSRNDYLISHKLEK